MPDPMFPNTQVLTSVHIEYFIIFLQINPIILLKHGQETGLFKPLLMTYCKKNDSF